MLLSGVTPRLLILCSGVNVFMFPVPFHGVDSLRDGIKILFNLFTKRFLSSLLRTDRDFFFENELDLYSPSSASLNACDTFSRCCIQFCFNNIKVTKAR